MKIVLLKDVQNIGRAGEIKEVSSGYARNFLIPKGLAQIASDRVLKILELRKAIQAKKAEESLEKTQQVAQALDDLELEIPMRVQEDGTSYGSVTEQMIADACSKAGYSIEKDHVRIAEPIKETGEYGVTIQLDHGLEATIHIVVVPFEDGEKINKTEKKKSGKKG